jgi:hypothetical protein
MSIKAQFQSRCGWCDETIYEGDDIEKVEGEWCHKDCANEAVVEGGEVDGELYLHGRITGR